MNGKIVIKAEMVEFLLKILDNDRFHSPANDEFFDFVTKELVQKKAAEGAADGKGLSVTSD